MMKTRTVKAVKECERETQNRRRTEMKVVRVSGNGQQALMTDGGVAHIRALDLISVLDAEAIEAGTWSEQGDADRMGRQALLLLHSDLQTACSRLEWWILSHHALIWKYPIPTAWRPTSVRWGPTPITAVSDRTRAWRDDESFNNGGSINMVTVYHISSSANDYKAMLSARILPNTYGNCDGMMHDSIR